MMKFWYAFLAFALLTVGVCGCAPENQPSDNTVKNAENFAPVRVVYSVNSTSKLKNGVASFATQYADLGLGTLVITDDSKTPDDGSCEILVGATNRTASAVMYDQYISAADDSKHFYAIVREEKSVCVVATDDDALLIGLKNLLNQNFSYKPTGSDGNVLCQREYEGDPVVFNNLVVWELESVSLIHEPPKRFPNAVLKYPTFIELTYQEDAAKNGILLVTGEDDTRSSAQIHRSTDGGVTWDTVARISDPIHKAFNNFYAPCLFELPVSVGDMPRGTIILGTNSVSPAWDVTHIMLYRSFDQGQTWEYFSTVAQSYRNTEFGVWEPNFVCTDEGRLICYYSDDDDKVCSQKLVLKYTDDGVNWSEQIDTVALENRGLRPGMPVVKRMGDGRYIMVYEIVGMTNNPVYFKITDNPIDWGEPTQIGTLIRSKDRKSLAATPWVEWIPAGGQQGMLVVTGWRMSSGSSNTGSDIFVSFNCGKSWTAIDNYYSYTWASDNDIWGYSVCTFFSSDGETMYYCVNPKGEGNIRSCFMLYKIKIS
ncbi:MAG: sialidase family protein [Eubacteriales bacterium]